MKIKQIKLKLNRDFPFKQGKKTKGTILTLDADANKIPLDLFWRRRLLDSLIDKCVEIVQTKEESKKEKI